MKPCNDPKPEPAFDSDTEIGSAAHLKEEYILFGPLGEEAYLRNGPKPPNNPRYAVDQIRDVFCDAQDEMIEIRRLERGRMWSNYEKLLSTIDDHPNQPALDTIYDFMRENIPRAAAELSSNPFELGLHLKEVHDFANSFLRAEDGSSRFPEILSDREAALVSEIVAPLHDIMKYLSSAQGQVIPDHEVLAAELVRRCLGKVSIQIDGKQDSLSPDEVEFVAGVVGDHESLNKERERNSWINSPQPFERAKAMFMVVDTLTGVFDQDPENSNDWQLNRTQLEERFTDLCFRHIDLVAGKIFRPEWVVSVTRHLSTTLSTLTERFRTTFSDPESPRSIKAILVAAGLTAMERAEKSAGALHGKRFSDAQSVRLAEQKEALSALLQ